MNRISRIYSRLDIAIEITYPCVEPARSFFNDRVISLSNRVSGISRNTREIVSPNDVSPFLWNDFNEGPPPHVELVTLSRGSKYVPCSPSSTKQGVNSWSLFCAFHTTFPTPVAQLEIWITAITPHSYWGRRLIDRWGNYRTTMRTFQPWGSNGCSITRNYFNCSSPDGISIKGPEFFFFSR